MAKVAKPKQRGRLVATAAGLTVTEVAELEDLRRQLERTAGGSRLRWNADPDDVQRSVAKLVLTLVEFIRRLLERQSIRRMEAGTLTPLSLSATVTVPVKDVNRPRTLVIMRWRAVKPTMLWLGSTFQTPGVRSDTLLMGRSSRG